MFSSDSKKITSVSMCNNLDSERDSIVFSNAPKELIDINHTPLGNGCGDSISSNYKDVAKIVYKKFITIEAIKTSFGKLKNKSPGLDDLVKAN
jgi:hypothetical protein